jgi:predicted AlkP superfamily pyrophosphatase or phosphodiesterase
MEKRVCVIDLPGLSKELIASVPESSALGRWLKGKPVSKLTPSFPAVTCSVQATLTTGVNPATHGMVANGIPTFRFPQDQALVDASNFAAYRRQISFWEQSNQFLEAPRFWQDSSGKSRWKTALLFFQNCMPGFGENLKPAADIVLTPKPDHGPDGKIVSLCWSQPTELVPALFKQLGPFPLMNYWGPMAGIASSQWIAKAAAQVWRELKPQLQLVYVPHLDYDLQRFGPGSEQAKKAVIDLAEALSPLWDQLTSDNANIVLLSEYAMRDVTRFVQPNVLLAEAGLLETRTTDDGKLIDYDRSSAFAMVDHQVAHVYVKDQPSKERAKKALTIAGVETIFDPAPRELHHRRAGDLVLQAASDAWFDYRWWSNPPDAPVFAKMVDIHRKPGYDPCELFYDPATRGVQQNPSLVRGSHGIAQGGEGAFVASSVSKALLATDVAGIIKNLLE